VGFLQHGWSVIAVKLDGSGGFGRVAPRLDFSPKNVKMDV
jgi:hypothetical protein